MTLRVLVTGASGAFGAATVPFASAYSVAKRGLAAYADGAHCCGCWPRRDRPGGPLAPGPGSLSCGRPGTCPAWWRPASAAGGFDSAPLAAGLVGRLTARDGAQPNNAHRDNAHPDNEGSLR